MNSQILKQAHRQAKKAQSRLGGNYVVYLSFYMKKENWLNEDEITKLYFLYLPFSAYADRKRLKTYLDYRWDSANKRWEVKASFNEIKECNLHMYIKNEESQNNDSKKWVAGNHSVPSSYVSSTGNYGMDVLSGFYTE